MQALGLAGAGFFRRLQNSRHPGIRARYDNLTWGIDVAYVDGRFGAMGRRDQFRNLTLGEAHDCRKSVAGRELALHQPGAQAYEMYGVGETQDAAVNGSGERSN